MIIGLPKTTEFNKKIPKQKFYDNLNISSSLKRVFVEQIESISWKNKITTSTTNLAFGKDVVEIEIFEVKLKELSISDEIFKLIDNQIPYHILFLLEYKGKYRALIGYKEILKGNIQVKVSKYYSTDWMAPDKLLLKLEGLNLDFIYESFIRQIAGIKLDKKNNNECLKSSIERNEIMEKLKKQIEHVQRKIRKEKQLNKQSELNTDLKKLKKELEEL